MPLCSYVLSAVQTADFCIHAWKRIGGRGSGFWCFVCVSVKGLQLTFLFTRPCISQPVLIRSEWCLTIAVWDFNNQWWAHWLGASLLAHSSMYCLAYFFFFNTSWYAMCSSSVRYRLLLQWVTKEKAAVKPICLCLVDTSFMMEIKLNICIWVQNSRFDHEVFRCLQVCNICALMGCGLLHICSTVLW